MGKEIIKIVVDILEIFSSRKYRKITKHI